MSLTNTLLAIAFGATINPSVVPEVSSSNRYPASDFILFCNTNLHSNFMAVLEDSAGITTAFFRDGNVMAIKKPGQKAEIIGIWHAGPTPNDITITPDNGPSSIIYDIEGKKCDKHFN